jgi:hypothetical protein
MSRTCPYNFTTYSPLALTLMTEATHSFKMFVSTYNTPLCHKPEDYSLSSVFCPITEANEGVISYKQLWQMTESHIITFITIKLGLFTLLYQFRAFIIKPLSVHNYDIKIMRCTTQLWIQFLHRYKRCASLKVYINMSISSN